MSVTPPGSSGSAGSGERRPLRRDAERNRQRILEAASEIFAERGLEASLDDIAEHAGVGVGTVYRRFPSKDDLLEALFEQKIEQLGAFAERAAMRPDKWQGLVAFLEGAIALQARDLGLRQVLLSNSYGKDRLARARARLSPLLTRLIVRAQEAGTLRPEVQPNDLPVILLMITSVPLYTRGVDEELWRRYLALVLDGLRAGPNRDPLPVDALGDGQLDQVMRDWDPARRLPSA